MRKSSSKIENDDPRDVAEERAKAAQDYSSSHWVPKIAFNTNNTNSCKSLFCFLPQRLPLASTGITKEFKGAGGSGKKVAVDNLPLAVNSGECFGLLGPNGGGTKQINKQKYNILALIKPKRPKRGCRHSYIITLRCFY